jgi:hypothetical protein
MDMDCRSSTLLNALRFPLNTVWFNLLNFELYTYILLQFCRTCLGTWSKNYWADREKVGFS